jgi:hypothetical protein
MDSLAPRWREKKAAEIKPLEIEAWFESLTSTPQGKKKPLTWEATAKVKSIMERKASAEWARASVCSVPV